MRPKEKDKKKKKCIKRKKKPLKRVMMIEKK